MELIESHLLKDKGLFCHTTALALNIAQKKGSLVAQLPGMWQLYRRAYDFLQDVRT